MPNSFGDFIEQKCLEFNLLMSLEIKVFANILFYSSIVNLHIFSWHLCLYLLISIWNILIIFHLFMILGRCLINLSIFNFIHDCLSLHSLLYIIHEVVTDTENKQGYQYPIPNLNPNIKLIMKLLWLTPSFAIHIIHMYLRTALRVFVNWALVLLVGRVDRAVTGWIICQTDA